MLPPATTPKSYTIEIVPNEISSEYLIKIKLHDCRIYIGEHETLTLLAGWEKLVINFSKQEERLTLPSCEAVNRETTLLTRIGETVVLQFCVVSQGLVLKENIGFNKRTFNDYSSVKNSLEVELDKNQHNITWTLRNISRDDIKFYLFRIRDNFKRTAIFTINLRLKDGTPYVCDNIEPNVEIHTAGKLAISLCIRSYPALSRDIFINSILYRINTTSNDVMVKSSFDVETFSNYLTLNIPRRDSLKRVNITVKSVEKQTFSVSLNVSENNDIETKAAMTITSTPMTTTASIQDLTTKEEHVTPLQTDNVQCILLVVFFVVILLLSIVIIYFSCFRKSENKQMLRDLSLYVNEDWYTPPTVYPPTSNNKERFKTCAKKWCLIIEFLTAICLFRIMAYEIQTCQRHLQNKVFVQRHQSSVNVSICFWSFSTNITKVTLQNNKYETRENVFHEWRPSATYFQYLDVRINNLTSSDYTEWSLILMSDRILFEGSLFIVRADSKNDVIFSKMKLFHYYSYTAELVCVGSNYPRLIQIINRCENLVLYEKYYNPKNYKREMTLTFTIEPVNRLSALECKVFDNRNITTSKFQDITLKNEPAFICPFKDKQIKANVYDTVSIRFKVLAYPEITSVIVTKSTTNNTSLDNEDVNWRVASTQLTEVLWFIELSKCIIQDEDFLNYSVSVTSNQKTSADEIVAIILKDPSRLIMIPENYCTNDTSTIVYRLVKSGLPLLVPSNMSKPYSTEIVPNKLASEYLIKVYLQNCAQFLGKQETFTLLAGPEAFHLTFSTRQNGYSLPLCVPLNEETTLLTSIGEDLVFTMCLISDSIIHEDNVGLNKMLRRKFNPSKYSVDIKQEENEHNITWTVRNITRDDIKFYVFRIRDNLKRTATLILNLKLKEGAPYFCDDSKTTVKQISEKTLNVGLCIRSYPVLSRDILINDVNYRIMIHDIVEGITRNTGDVAAVSSVDEKTFSNYITLEFPETYILKPVNITLRSVKNVTFSLVLNLTLNN
ncbi:hypothetical protein BgiMline_031351, partial [Biomphalaria glabrata]